MKKKLKKILSYFDNLSFKYKTSFLVFIIAGGMLCIVILSQISTFTIKEDFDIFFDKRTKSLIKLENIKDTYKVNMQDTLKDLEKGNINYPQAKEVLKLAQQLINNNWESYKEEISRGDGTFLINTFIKKFIVKNNDYDENIILKENIIKNIDYKLFQIKNQLDKIDIENENAYFNLLNLEINAISIYITS